MNFTGNLGALIQEIRNLEAIKAESFLAQGKIRIVRNYSVEFIAPYLKWELFQRKIRPTLEFSDYDNVLQDLMTEAPHGKPDLTVLSLVLENLDPPFGTVNWKCDTAKNRLEEILTTAKENLSGLVVLNTFVPPYISDQGSLTTGKEKSTRDEVLELNSFLKNFVSRHQSRFVLLDWEAYVFKLGWNNCIDLRLWALSKNPFKREFLELFAADLAKVMANIKGLQKKCLVLDCDNTLWGGVVGEEGVAGLQLHPDELPGTYFYEFQKNLIKLKERGVLLCLCSKNNLADVLEVFEKHPHSLLKADDFVGKKINWENKATNIQSLAQELNLGLNSFVFLDDNQAEVELVKQALPEVATYVVPTALENYGSLLLRMEGFDYLSKSKEDQVRSQLYLEEAERSKARSSFANIDEYLASLQMKIEIGIMSSEDLPRVAQLTQKTNQFNLTTKRYSESDVLELAAKSNYAVVTLRAQDKFGEYGLTGVGIFRLEGSSLVVDTFLMSCRIIGRNIETAFLAKTFEFLEAQWKFSQILGSYKPTAKNAQVENFWPSLGFEFQEKRDSEALFVSRLEKKITSPSYINVVGKNTQDKTLRSVNDGKIVPEKTL